MAVRNQDILAETAMLIIFPRNGVEILIYLFKESQEAAWRNFTPRLTSSPDIMLQRFLGIRAFRGAGRMGDDCAGWFSEDERLVLKLRHPYLFEDLSDKDGLSVEEVALTLLADEHMSPAVPGAPRDPAAEEQQWNEAMRIAQSRPKADRERMEQRVKGWTFSGLWKLKICIAYNVLGLEECQVIRRRNVGTQGYRAISRELQIPFKQVLLYELNAEWKIFEALNNEVPEFKWRRYFRKALDKEGSSPAKALTDEEALVLRFDRIDRVSIPAITPRVNKAFRSASEPQLMDLDTTALSLSADDKCYYFNDVNFPACALLRCMLSNISYPSQRRLTPLEALVMKYHVMDKLPQGDVAKRVAVSVARVAELRSDAFGKLRDDGCDLGKGFQL